MITQETDTIPLVTLVGPPNSGKTTLFNFLSGKHFKTVNYPGSTVDYSVSKIQDKYNLNINLLDSPGIISLIPNSPDEEVSVNSIYKHPLYGNPELIITTVDATQISRHLLLVKQLLKSGFRVIVVLTMVDLLNRKGLDISTETLSELLNCEVVKLNYVNKKKHRFLNGNNHSNNLQQENDEKDTGIDDLLKIVDEDLKKIAIQGQTAEPEVFKYSNSDDLLAMFKEIEELEQKVIYRLPDNSSLKHANKKLNVINNQKSFRHKGIDETTLAIDKFLLHKYWGLLLFFAIMSLTFTSIFWLAQPLMYIVDSAFGYLGQVSASFFGNNWYGDLISNGIIGGTGSVLVFVPQIFILFLILGLLEDSGYLARGAMLVDKPLSKIGLNGKSFVPMLSGFACAIPAMMAARTIPNRKERLITIFIIPLMSCSARLPVYALLIGFLVPIENKWIGGVILASVYILGLFSSILIASLINKFSKSLLKTNDLSSFILELPAYRKPKLSVIYNNTLNNAGQYIKRAGPTILAFSMIVWFISYFPDYKPNVDTKNKTQAEIVDLQNSIRLENSYSANIGKFIQPVMNPIGLDWRVGVSLVSAFAAREVFVSSMATIFKITDPGDDLQGSILKSMKNAKIEPSGKPLFTTATVIGLIVFFMFALQCVSTIAVSKKETGSWRIPLLQLFFLTSLAYLMTFITVNGLRALGIN